jgi:hypothetical protein
MDVRLFVRSFVRSSLIRLSFDKRQVKHTTDIDVGYLSISAFYSIIIAVFFEAIAVSWLYGIKRISDDVQQMLGSKPGKFWLGTWCVAAPVFLGVNHIHFSIRLTS